MLSYSRVRYILTSKRIYRYLEIEDRSILFLDQLLPFFLNLEILRLLVFFRTGKTYPVLFERESSRVPQIEESRNLNLSKEINRICRVADRVIFPAKN